MNRSALLTWSLAASTLPLALLSAYLSSSAHRAAAEPNSAGSNERTAQAVTSPQALPVAPGAAAVVDAANAFAATLSDGQRATVQVDLTSRFAAKWSNFPAAVVPRNGVYFRDLNPAQTEAALKVARLALSKDGFERFQSVRSADDAFAKSDDARRGPGGGGPRRQGEPGGQGGPPPDGGGFGGNGGQGGPPPGGFGGPEGQGGPPGGFGGPGGSGGANLFGAGNYTIAFLGKPSKTTPWLLQLGGHHIAFNLYYKGTSGTATPYFVGVQPSTWKDSSGKTHEPLAPLHDAMHALTNSLTPDQLAKARLEQRFSDVYVGPGRDGKFPAKSEGVSVAELSPASRDLVKKAIAAWTGDSLQSAEYRELYDSELDKTRVAYSGSTALNKEGDYVRIDGPHVWIEFACQASDHYHTIWRDRATDYGTEFTF